MREPVPGPAYRIETGRLVIRCWEPVDAPLLKAAIDANLDHLRPWMPWAHREPTGLQDKIELLREFRGTFDLGQDFVYGIFDAHEEKVLGGTGLHTRAGEGAREIGYWIHQAHVRQGLATEVSAALVRVAVEVDGVHRVEIHCDPRNVASIAIPRKLGFAHEGTLRQRTASHDGIWEDSMIWTLLADEYPASPAAGVAVAAFDVVGRRIL